MNHKPIIVIAGGTGNLGERIIRNLLSHGAEVRAIVRPDSAKIKHLESLGAQVSAVNMADESVDSFIPICQGATCVISALAGLREVIMDTQQILLNAAVAAGVPRFIPSDYSLDFTKFSPGENRNLDLRREFHTILDQAPTIAATTILNGAFADMLTDQIPMIFPTQKRILHWGGADHKMGFTTIDNVATFTAMVAVDPQPTPRYLYIAGDQISACEIKNTMATITGQDYRLFRTGGQRLLGWIIKIAQTLSPAERELYPAWQGMQYMHNMIDDRANMPAQLDNDRYPGKVHWTTVQEVLEAHFQQNTPAANS